MSSQPLEDLIPPGARVPVIGAGIAGAAVTRALVRAGRKVDLYDPADSVWTRSGNVLVLESRTASQLHDWLGVDTKRLHLGRRRDGWSPEDAYTRLGNIVTTWQQLFVSFVIDLPSDSVTFHNGKRLVGIDENQSRQPQATFTDGTIRSSPIIFGCDGRASSARDPNRAPKYQGYVIWQGVLPAEAVGEGVFGDRHEFDARENKLKLVWNPVRRADESGLNIHWWLPMNAPTPRAVLDTRQGEVRSDIQQWVREAASIGFAGTPELAQIVMRTAEISGIPAVATPLATRTSLETANGTTLLFGDALATFPPIAGVGAQQPIWQATELGRLLEPEKDRWGLYRDKPEGLHALEQRFLATMADSAQRVSAETTRLRLGNGTWYPHKPPPRAIPGRSRTSSSSPRVPDNDTAGDRTSSSEQSGPGAKAAATSGAEQAPAETPPVATPSADRVLTSPPRRTPGPSAVQPTNHYPGAHMADARTQDAATTSQVVPGERVADVSSPEIPSSSPAFVSRPPAISRPPSALAAPGQPQDPRAEVPPASHAPDNKKSVTGPHEKPLVVAEPATEKQGTRTVPQTTRPAGPSEFTR